MLAITARLEKGAFRDSERLEYQLWLGFCLRHHKTQLKLVL